MGSFLSLFQAAPQQIVPPYSQELIQSSVFNTKHIFQQNSFLQYLHHILSEKSVGIPISSSNVNILQEPSDFYNHIIDGIKKAQNRVVLSSLYLGTGEQEQAIVKAIEEKLASSPNFKVTILLDCLRGTRTDKKMSSVTMLLPIVTRFTSQVEVFLFHTPKLKGIFKRFLPERVNEVVGVQHMKLYIFDDDLLISGANLSDWYFVDRQDRYIYISNETRLCEYFVTLINTVNSFSYQLKTSGKLELSRITADPVLHSSEFKKVAEERVRQFLANQKLNYIRFLDGKGESVKQYDTWVFPSIQMGPLNITQDEQITCALLSLLSNSSISTNIKAYLAAAYFNVTKEYINWLLAATKPVDIITASPKANGFFTAKGASKYIPHCYNVVEQDFYHKVEARKKTDLVKINEFNRPAWTFHAKGLWIYDQEKPAQESVAPTSSTTIQPQEKLSPCLTLVGSPNFGQRSVTRDIEAQIVMLTNNKELQRKMDHECNYLYSTSYPVTGKHIFKTAERKGGLIISFLTKFLAHKYL